MRNIILTTSCFLIIMGSYGQTAILGCGAILAVEDEKPCLDFNETNISVGDRMQVIEHRGFFTHPETGEQKPVEPDVIKAGTRKRSRDTRLADRNAKITLSEYSEVSTKNRQTFTVNIDRGKDAGYRNWFSYDVYESRHGQTYEQSRRFIRGRQKIGTIRLNHIEKNMSQGIVTLRKNVNRSQEHNFEEAIIEFANYRRLIITPITFSMKPDPVPLDIFAGTYQATLFKLSYRLNGFFSVGLRWKGDYYARRNKSIIEMQAWDVFGGLNYRFLKTLEPFMNFGYSAVINYYSIGGQRANPKFSERIFLEFGIMIFATNWFSVDFLAPIHPFTSFGLGVSFHMF